MKNDGICSRTSTNRGLIMRIDFAKAWNIFVHNLPLFQYGIEMTLLFAFVGTFAGFVVGLLVGGIRAIEINEYDSTGIKVLKR